MIVNVLGCFFLALLTTVVLQGAVRPEWRLILGTGFLGAFTTFSTFELETEELMARGAKIAAALYVSCSLGLGFGALVLGRLLALRLLASFAGQQTLG
jgi:CrcB protein